MKILFAIGILLVVLGVVSLFVSYPQTEEHSVGSGDFKIGVQTTEKKPVPPVISAALILGGMGAMIAGSRRSA